MFLSCQLNLNEELLILNADYFLASTNIGMGYQSDTLPARLMLTQEGYCFTLNSLPANELYTDA